MSESLDKRAEVGKANLAKAREKGLNSRKGTPNKTTANIKAMIEESLKLAGGVDYFHKQSQENPQAYMQLIGKILPKNMTLDVDVESNINKKVTFEVIHAEAKKLKND
jgi:hypothetical protein